MWLLLSPPGLPRPPWVPRGRWESAAWPCHSPSSPERRPSLALALFTHCSPDTPHSLASKAGSQAAQEGRRPALQGVAPRHGQHLDPSRRLCTSFMHTRDSPRKLGVRGTLNGQQAEPEEAHEAIPGRRGVFLTFSQLHVAPSHPHLLRAKEDTRSPPGARARHGQSRAWRCLV